MRVAVVGATGLIGSAVAAALAERHEVVRGSRSAGVRVDIGDASSIERFLGEVGPVDAVVCCAGRPRWGPMTDLAAADYLGSLHEKLLGQILLTKLAIPHLRDGGVIVLTAGLLARHAIAGSTAAACSSVNSIMLQMMSAFSISATARAPAVGSRIQSAARCIENTSPGI